MPYAINIIQSNAAKVELKYKKYIYLYIYLCIIHRHSYRDVITLDIKPMSMVQKEYGIQ